MEIKTSRPTQVTAPSEEPVTSTQAKKHLEIASSDTAHDDHITLLITAARQQWEHDTDSAVLTQTLRVNADGFYDDEIYLPRRPIQSITSITYLDTNQNSTTLSTSTYELDAESRAVRLKYLQTWPTTIDNWNAVTITYVAGYSSVANVPAIAKQAILLLIGHYFENRDMLLSDAMTSVKAYESLVAKFMRSTYP